MKKYFKYKGVTVNSFGIPVFNSKKKVVTRYGTPRRRYYQYRYFDYNFPSSAPRDLVVVYDIPSDKRKERDWFRRHLRKFGYTMIKQSVWVGPSPLPKNFLKYVKSVGLSKQLITLKLAKPYLKGNSIAKF